jgi:hypothetical protein
LGFVGFGFENVQLGGCLRERSGRAGSLGGAPLGWQAQNREAIIDLVTPQRKTHEITPATKTVAI